MGVDIKDDTVLLKLRFNIVNIPNDEATMTECHNVMAQYMNPYVPMREGNLSTDIDVNGERVRYLSPYAHYQFEGIVYGPNIPIIENGVIVGWWSRPNKQPTGQQLVYSTEKHPQATHHWHKAMMRDKRDEFTKDIKTIIKNNINKGGV